MYLNSEQILCYPSLNFKIVMMRSKKETYSHVIVATLMFGKPLSRASTLVSCENGDRVRRLVGPALSFVNVCIQRGMVLLWK